MRGLPLRFFNCLEVLCRVLTDGYEICDSVVSIVFS